ncbi:transglutaminase family protein [Sulfuritalea sp.]|uniref:transglutaminase-like domain-containing protein n=1 Tax=Sulfuritalea sp. TaxID=2480090 RepID=UPI00286E6D58|nr:transglutaminase family protein [Sulfuritalea sp.]
MTAIDPAWLAATEFIDHEHPAIREFVAARVGACRPAKRNSRQTESGTAKQQALSLYYAVRDGIRYDPYSASMQREAMRASTTLVKRVGYCVPKALLYAACLRAVGIPARPGFADVRNHLSTEKLDRLMGTDIYAWHGYVSLWLDGKWVKATPAFNLEMCQRFGVLPLDFDGEHDSQMHPYNSSNQRHMEYVKQRGEFDDLPYDELVADMLRMYPQLVAVSEGQAGDFDHEAIARPAA